MSKVQRTLDRLTSELAQIRTSQEGTSQRLSEGERIQLAARRIGISEAEALRLLGFRPHSDLGRNESSSERPSWAWRNPA